MAVAERYAVRAYGLTAECDWPLPGAVTTANEPAAVQISRLHPGAFASRWHDDADPIFTPEFPDGRTRFTVERTPGQYQLWLEDFGRYLIAADGTWIGCEADSAPRAAQDRFVFAQALPVAAVLQGTEVIHAGAVCGPDGAAAFLGVSGSGKTTLTAHLVLRGATFVTDDVLALAVRDGDILIHPGPPFMAIRPEDAWMAGDSQVGPAVGASDKIHVARQVPDTAVPLRALSLPCARERAEHRAAGRRRPPGHPRPGLRPLHLASGASAAPPGARPADQRPGGAVPPPDADRWPGRRGSERDRDPPQRAGRPVICGLIDLTGRGAGHRLPATATVSAGSATITSDSPELTSARLGGLTCAADGVLFDVAADDPAAVIARAYRQAGLAGLAGLRGRFTAVLWDESTDHGLLTTDLLATRQIYTHAVPGGLAFAGEIRDLLPLLPRRPAPDPVAFPAWLISGACPEGRTLYGGVARLGPGECLEIAAGTARRRTFWQPRFAGTSDAGRQPIVDGLRDAILGATERRLSRHTDGVILSGGLDSSIVTAAAHARKQPPGTVATYSAVFPGAPYDEGDKIRALTQSLGIEARTLQVAPQGMLWQALTYLRDWQVPLAGMGAIIDLAAASRAQADGIDVILDGQTGDEVLGFAPYLIADRLRRGQITTALHLIDRWPGRPPARLRQKLWLLREFGLKGAAPHRFGQRVRDRRVDHGQGAPWLLPHLRAQESTLEDRWAWKQRGDGPLWWRHLVDLQIYGPHREPRLEYLRHRAAANGLVPASPLYDPDLIAHVLTIPPALQFDPGYDRPLAREAMRGLLPDSIRLQRQKADFSAFCRRSITGADADGLQRVLTAPDALIGAYVDVEWVRRAWPVLRSGSPAAPRWG